MTVNQKITLKLEIDDNSIYEIFPPTVYSVIDGLYVYTWDHDPRTVSKIAVKLVSGLVKIKEIACGGIPFYWLDKFGVYTNEEGKRLSGTYGYMNIPNATYTFKRKYSGKSYYYMLHLLNIFSN